MGTLRQTEEGQERRGREWSTRRENILNSRRGGGLRCWQKTKLIGGDRVIALFSSRREGKDDDDVKCNYWQYLYQRLLCNC